MIAGKHIDPAEEYENLAMFVEKRYGQAIDVSNIRALLDVQDYLIEEIKDQVSYGLYRFDAQEVVFTRVDIEGL